MRSATALAIATLAIAAPARAGQKTLEFPTYQRTTPAESLGSGAGALSLGVNAMGINPASLSTTRPEFLTSFRPMLEGSNLMQLGLAAPLRSLKSTVALGYMGLNSGSLSGRDSSGQETGGFESKESIYSLAVSHQLRIPSIMGDLAGKALDLGVAVKRIESKLAGFNAQTLAFDFGARYALAGRPLSLGLSMLNLGKGLQYLEQGDFNKLPLSFQFSGAYQFAGSIVAVGGMDYQMHDDKASVSAGLQYQAGILSIRGKYTMTAGDVNTGIGYNNLTAGLGVNILNGTTFDYGFRPLDSSLAASGSTGMHNVSLTVRFGQDSVASKRWSSFTGETVRPAPTRKPASSKSLGSGEKPDRREREKRGWGDNFVIID